MRHLNAANDVGDVVWFDPSVGGTGFILEVSSRVTMSAMMYHDIVLGSSRCSEQELNEVLRKLQGSRDLR